MEAAGGEASSASARIGAAPAAPSQRGARAQLIQDLGWDKALDQQPEVLSWSPPMAGLGGEISPADPWAVLAAKAAFALINFICVISSAINSTWHEEKSGKLHSNHE